MKKVVISGLCGLMLLTGCQQGQGMGPKEGVGTAGGAIGGALLGSMIGQGTGKGLAIAGGALLGGWLGNEIGSSLDNADRAQMQQAEYRAYSAPLGQQITWNNPQSGNYGTIVPVRDGYDNRSGTYCREFQQKVTVGGKTQSAFGTACQQPDGSWQIVGS